MAIKNFPFREKINDCSRHPKKEASFAMPAFLEELSIKDINADFIWLPTCEPHSVCLFVKDFELEALPDAARAFIAAESKYILWINGEKVVFEGGLKRGFAPDGIYCDEIDIIPYLKAGKNRIAAWVRYFGEDGYSHVDSGSAGFLFYSPEIAVSSDKSFKCVLDEAYIPNLDSDLLPNYRLVEGNIYFDASKEIADFFKPDYDVSNWQNATEIAFAGEKPFGKLYPRIIPMFKDFGVKEFLNSETVLQKKKFSDSIYELELPYNCQFAPIIEVDAPAGKRIDVYTDFYYDNNGWSQRLAYITKKGVQKYESPSWINGQKAYFHIPGGVKVISLKYRETGYNSEILGEFNSSDSILNAVYKKALPTLYVNMRDTFMDCPNRERAQWAADTANESEQCFYSMDENSYLMVKKAILSTAAWQHKNNVMQTVVPEVIDLFELPLENLAQITSFITYYKYTGDAEVLPMAYKLALSYLSRWQTEESGLVSHYGGSWDWPDWGIMADMPVLENAWYYFALKTVIELNRILEKDGYEILTERANRLKSAFDHAFYDGTAYSSGGAYDDRANAVAVCSGLADKDTYDGIAKVFENTYNSSPYMEKYVLEALCKMGRYETAKNRIRKRYGEMAKSDCSTLWESWADGDGSKNHGWSGGPLVIMGKYFAGVSPLQEGFKSYIVKPNLAGLIYFNAKVPTPKGIISVSCEKTEEIAKYRFNLVENANAVIAIELKENEKIAINGEAATLSPKAKTAGLTFLKQDEKCVYFAAPAGNTEITVY